MAVPRTQVLFVEDHEPLGLALAMSFDGDPRFEVGGVARDIPEALILMAGIHVDLVIVDLNLPGGSGLDLIPQLASITPTARYLMFSAEEPARIEAAAKSAGAAGYLQKGTPMRALLDVAADVASEREYFPGINIA